MGGEIAGVDQKETGLFFLLDEGRDEQHVPIAKDGLGKRTFTVLVVDDYEPWRDFASKTFQKTPDLKIIGEASDGSEAVRKAQELQPDLILLDIGLPTLNGIEAAKQIRDISPASKILFLSENRSPDIVEAALSIPASGYIVKSDAARELLPASKPFFRAGSSSARDYRNADRRDPMWKLGKTNRNPESNDQPDVTSLSPIKSEQRANPAFECRSQVNTENYRLSDSCQIG